MTFKLVNPNVSNQEFISKRSSPNKAAGEIWKEFSKNISNYTPKFYFSILNTKDNSLHHFKVKETLKNDNVNHVISNIKLDVDNNEILKQLKTQKGGKSSFLSDDSSSSSSDDFRYTFNTYNNSPYMLNYWPNIYRVPNVVLPTFVSSFTPFVRINVPITSPLVVYTH
jgi:hypothetical protein